MGGCKTVRPHQRSEERPLLNRKMPLPSGLSYRGDLMREPCLTLQALDVATGVSKTAFLGDSGAGGRARRPTGPRISENGILKIALRKVE